MTDNTVSTDIAALWNLVCANRDTLIEHLATQLLASSLHPVQGLTPSLLPAEAGVYIFYRTGIEQPFHVGESKNLRQRIYQNQLRGELGQSPLKRKVKKLLGLEGAGLKEYIFANFQVQYMPLHLFRIEVEDYLHDKYGIVESSPHA